MENKIENANLDTRQTQEKTYYKIFDYGFNSDKISCRGVEFSEKDWNILRNKNGEVNTNNLVLCENGFHFCETVDDCLDYYNVNRKDVHKYALAEIEVRDYLPFSKNSNKSVCREFRIKKIWKSDNLHLFLMNRKIEKIYEIYSKFQSVIPNIRLCGGLSHEMLGLKDNFYYKISSIHDIDFSVFGEVNFETLRSSLPEFFADSKGEKNKFGFTYDENPNKTLKTVQQVKQPWLFWEAEAESDLYYPGESSESTIKMKYKDEVFKEGLKIDLFMTNEIEGVINFNYNGKLIKISHPKVAIMKKFEYILESKNPALVTKHASDLVSIFQNIMKIKTWN